eukprot:6492802-Amphidinium_carterae.1
MLFLWLPFSTCLKVLSDRDRSTLEELLTHVLVTASPGSLAATPPGGSQESLQAPDQEDGVARALEFSPPGDPIEEEDDKEMEQKQKEQEQKEQVEEEEDEEEHQTKKMQEDTGAQEPSFSFGPFTNQPSFSFGPFTIRPSVPGRSTSSATAARASTARSSATSAAAAAVSKASSSHPPSASTATSSWEPVGHVPPGRKQKATAQDCQFFHGI